MLHLNIGWLFHYIFLQMIDLKLAAAFIGWTGTTFVAHYSIKRILVAATTDGAEVWLKVLKCVLREGVQYY